jgi:hypothetical protein
MAKKHGFQKGIAHAKSQGEYSGQYHSGTRWGSRHLKEWEKVLPNFQPRERLQRATPAERRTIAYFKSLEFDMVTKVESVPGIVPVESMPPNCVRGAIMAGKRPTPKSPMGTALSWGDKIQHFSRFRQVVGED